MASSEVTVVTDLQLNSDDDAELSPRRLLDFGNDNILAWGGDTGDVSCNGGTPFRYWDENDDIRAVAIYGNRVAVGFETGGTHVYTYEDDEISRATKHPFLQGPPTPKQTTMLSVFSGAVRELQFRSNTVLAIATEEGMCVVNVNTKESYLQHESKKCHEDGGIRSVAFSSTTAGATVTMASLAMDGRLCLWDASDQDPAKWKLQLREEGRCITKKDIGELLGADPWDISCRPHFISNTVLALPGETYLQLRHLAPTIKSHDNMESGGGVGHVESIVAMASKAGFLVTTGRDKRVLLWSMRKNTATATFVRQIAEVESAPTDVLFHGDKLLIACANGKLVTVNDIVLAPPVSAPALTKASAGTTRVKKSAVTFEDSDDEEEQRDAAKRAVEKATTTVEAAKPPASITKDVGPTGKDDKFKTLKAAGGSSNEIVTESIAHVKKITTTMPDLDSSDDEQGLANSAAPKSSAPVAKKQVEERSSSPTLPQLAADRPKLKSADVYDLADSDDDDFGTGNTNNNDSPAPTQKSTASQDNSPSPAQNKFVEDEAAGDDDSLLSDGDTPAKNMTTPAPTQKTTSTQDNSPSPAQNKFVEDEAASGDDIQMGDGDTLAKSMTASFGETTEFPDNDDDASDGEYDGLPHPTSSAVAHVDLPQPQPAFAPSSSPLDLARRFMCWNHIGSVTLRRDGTGRSSVDINFTDSGFRRPLGFTDTQGFIIGSLGEDGGIFATDLADVDDDDLDDDIVQGLSETTKQAVKLSKRTNDPNKPTGSSIYFHRFESFANVRHKDWYLTLPSGERALGCATGEGWAAVMTSRRFLRLFSSGGNQGQVLWLEGQPVTMAGRGRFLAVFFHEGEPLRDGTQKIGYKLIDAVSNRVIATGSTSCIGARATLRWVGFNNDGSLLAMDSEGMLSMLVSTDSSIENASWEWMPMLDTLGLRKSTDDSHWPITVYDGKLVCVPLKGGTKYPDASRRPVTASLSLRLPLARGTLSKSNALEELSVRAAIALGQKKVVQDISNDGDEDEEFEREYLALSAQVDKVTLKMFATTVEASKLERALDLVERLNLEKSFELAMAIADHHRKLVDLIEDAKDRKFGGDQEDEEDTYESQPATNEYSRPRISPDSSSARKRPLDDIGSRQVRQKQTFA